jgi:SAM-dependent methyltransferase
MSDKAKEIARQIGGGRWLQGYVCGKLRTDPVFRQAQELLQQRPGPVFDLGCGLGLLGFWLRSQGIDNPYMGCDLGAWKIKAGQAAAENMNLKNFVLSVGNMTNFPTEGAATICLFDVLHYLPLAEQEKFLERLAQAARGGALLLIRTGVKGCGWRSAVTVLEEVWTRASGWIGGGEINFPRIKSLEDFFTTRGCRVSTRPLWGRTPFSSHWLEIRAE